MTIDLRAKRNVDRCKQMQQCLNAIDALRMAKEQYLSACRAVTSRVKRGGFAVANYT